MSKCSVSVARVACGLRNGVQNPRLVVHAKTTLLGVAQDFMVSMTTMGIFQVTAGSSHCADHTLDLVFCSGQKESDQSWEEFKAVPLSWTDHYMLKFGLSGVPRVHGGGD